MAENECPKEWGIWLEVAIGLLPDEEAMQLISHASRCDKCGPLLREAVQDLTMEPTPEELAQIERVCNPEWRRRMAEMMAEAQSNQQQE